MRFPSQRLSPGSTTTNTSLTNWRLSTSTEHMANCFDDTNPMHTCVSTGAVDRLSEQSRGQVAGHEHYQGHPGH